MTAIETSGRDNDLVLEEARVLAKSYGLGDDVSLRPLPEGYANTNYALETASGTFLYRICRQKSEGDLAAELAVLERLEEKGFRAAYPIRRDDGDFISTTPSGTVVLYSYIEGEEPRLTPETAGEAARGRHGRWRGRQRPPRPPGRSPGGRQGRRRGRQGAR